MASPTSGREVARNCRSGAPNALREASSKAACSVVSNERVLPHELMGLALEGWEWEVLDLVGDTLRLVGAVDLTYGWSIEIGFTGCTYLSLPTHFFHARFVDATDQEVAAVTLVLGGERPLVLSALVTDETPTRHLIAAERITIKREIARRH